MAATVTQALAVLLGFAAGLAGAALMLARARMGALPVDLPDDRRLHQTPTPRGGGIGIPVAGLLAAPFALAAAPDPRPVWIVLFVWALPNGILGYIDDHRPLRSRVKFAIQTGLAIAAVALGLRLDVLEVPPFPPLALGWAAYPFTVLWLVWMGNLYNFMDGMDALGAGSGLVFFATFALLSPALAPIPAAMAAGMGGFLVYNRPPARIFMGDAASLFVGALLGGLAVAAAPPVPFAASVLLMGTFIWDTTFTIVRRLLRGDPMLPHRTHLFQRLALAGWSHARVRALYFGLALAFAGAALAYPRLPRPAQAAILVGALVACLALVLVTRRREARGSSP
jgi:UDP-N-acetylmuramyl pentapeptide phosphotransferase/UDP-N-acetylglucosamine-1-phosphate transferase